ncbi:prepilin peptidase [Pseudoruegeria sp. SHC-113]|uniref:prepilin peptidase n=1 Tax=Pseudoruegeria sp. SHC-113 TaxID=2855439 RepID=UPI0021BB41F5|nr:A24 family peptidase [Pseudoruegeria sp. SHC-113]MCT8161676.1 prepilin peptidase [Pseudoruegeria sp. SHC-113]
MAHRMRAGLHHECHSFTALPIDLGEKTGAGQIQTPFPTPTGLLVYLLLIAPFVGSFLAVLADRLPRGEGVIRGRSRCRSCGAAFGWRDLVPVLSWLRLKGRCRACGGRIPAWLTASEALALVCVGLAAVAAQGGVADLVLLCLILWVAQALAFSDALWMRLPDPLVAGLLALALLRAALPWGMGLPEALAGAALGSGVFWAIRFAYAQLRGREGMGLGDVKLMAPLGALVGPFGLAPMVLIAALLALGFGLIQAKADGALSGTTAVPFGTTLLLAMAGVLCL